MNGSIQTNSSGMIDVSQRDPPRFVRFAVGSRAHIAHDARRALCRLLSLALWGSDGGRLRAPAPVSCTRS